MQITFYSVMMTVFWSSILVILFSLLQKNHHIIDVCNIYGIVLLYVFCVIRMFMPIEFFWTQIIPSTYIYNNLYHIFKKEILHIGSKNIYIYHFLYSFWFGITLLLLIHLFYKYYKYKNIIKKLPIDKSVIHNKIANQVMEKNDHKKITIVTSSAIKEPMSFGIIHKKILLPDYVYSEKEMYYIIKHESIHLKNNDLLVQLLVNILCAFYWWNPFVYLLRYNLEKNFEFRCDQIVIKKFNQEEVVGYLETILKIYKSQQENYKYQHNKAGILGVADNNGEEIKERFEMLLKKPAKNYEPYGKLIVTGLVLVLMVLSYSFILQPSFLPSQNEIETTANTYEINNSNSCIIKYTDNTYVLKSNFGYEYVIDEEFAKELVQNENLKIIEKGGNKNDED